MDIKTTLNHLNNTQETVAKLLTQIKEYVKSDAPFEDRWDTYLQIEKLLPNDSCSFNLHLASEDMGCGELIPYDDLNQDRYEVMTFSSMVEKFQEKYNDEHDENCGFFKFREAIMQSGKGGTDNDH